MSPVEQFISIARSWVGTKEEPLGSNRGFHIDLWNKAVGVPVGSFWCASFMSSVANRWKFVTNLDWRLGVSADCDLWLARARKLGIVRTTPAIGDIGLILNPNNSNDAIHIFLVSGKKDGAWMSIEGNSNDDGSRNGTAVVERQLYRFRSKARMVFLRWADLIDEQDKAVVKVFGKTIEPSYVSNRAYVPLRVILEAVYGEDDVEQRLSFELVPLWDGGTIPCSVIISNGKSMIGLRDFSNWQDLAINYLESEKAFVLTRI